MNARISILFAAACLGSLIAAGGAQNADKKEVAMSIQVTSTAFADGRPIPDKYTCSGADISPPLAWSGAPAGTKSLALIADDPDAPMGTWVHWVIYNLPPTPALLGENTPRSPELPDGAKQGVNDFGKTGYGGPCPPSGRPHHYHFKIYALDTPLDLKPGATKKQLLTAMDGHVLAQGQLIGTYQR